MPKKRTSRVYWRQTGNARRAYGDFRDLGGGRERLIAPGETQATTDPDVADQLVAARVRQLEAQRRDRAVLGVKEVRTLLEYASHHLAEKAETGKVTAAWLEESERRLREAVDFFGAERDLRSITPADVKLWIRHLRQKPGRRGGRLSEGSLKHFLNALSNLYQRASEDEAVPAGYNPVRSLADKPAPHREEARFLTVPEVALLLESARTYTPKRPDLALPHGYALLATLFLTGMRWSEAAGLMASDVSMDRGTVTVRENAFRRLKTKGSRRVVPLWDQLREILQGHIGARPPSRLLFPAFVDGKEQMVTDIRRYLDAVAMRAGWQKGEIRTRVARHSYTLARLQTTENGAPVSPYTVAREMGWRSLEMIFETYGHLGTVGERKPFVEYRVEQWQPEIAERLERLRASS